MAATSLDAWILIDDTEMTASHSTERTHDVDRSKRAPASPSRVRRDGRSGSERRQARAARSTLERDIAAYTSAADRADLGAILSRHTEAETAEIRQILARIRT
jgi:hypothetical protein